MIQNPNVIYSGSKKQQREANILLHALSKSETSINNTLEVNSFVPAWTTLAAELATKDSRPRPYQNEK